MKTQSRIILYGLTGLFWGVLDFYYERYISTIEIDTVLLWFLRSWVPWLIPLIPVVVVEARQSQSVVKACLAGTLVWCISVVTYYLYLWVFVVFIGQPSLAFLHISQARNAYYWHNVGSFMLSQMMQSIPWLLVALLGNIILSMPVAIWQVQVKGKKRGK